MIFADPPYFLSNGGISVQSGKMVSVNKGDWNRSKGFEKNNEFNYNWLKACREHLTEERTIWSSKSLRAENLKLKIDKLLVITEKK